jgi:hypothetical protein
VDERPVELTRALRALAALVVVGGVTVVLIVIFHDSLIRSWAEGNPATRHLLRTEGLAAVKAGTVRPPHFVAPALTMYVVIVSLLWVLGQFLRNGFEWGRIGITVLLLCTAVASVGAILTDPPVLFTVCTIVAIVVGIGALVLMWLPPVTRYIHPPAATAPRPADPAPAVSATRG